MGWLPTRLPCEHFLANFQVVRSNQRPKSRKSKHPDRWTDGRPERPERPDGRAGGRIGRRVSKDQLNTAIIPTRYQMAGENIVSWIRKSGFCKLDPMVPMGPWGHRHPSPPNGTHRIAQIQSILIRKSNPSCHPKHIPKPNSIQNRIAV